MIGEPVRWPDEVDEVIRGDLTAAAAYITPAGGAVVTAVAPVGIGRRDAGKVGFTTSLGFPRKLERIIGDPHVALAFHAREHGFSASPAFVLAQGRAQVDIRPSRERLEAIIPQAERYFGAVVRGPVWDRLLREYYFTGWLDVTSDGTAVYAPHTSKGFVAPPRKKLLLVSNGLFAKYGMWQARRQGTAERLERLAAGPGQPRNPV